MEDGIENSRTTIYDVIEKKDTSNTPTETRLYVCSQENGLLKDCIITNNKSIAQDLLNKKYKVSIFIVDSFDLYNYKSELHT
jgi:hypothetical protein